MEEKQEELLYRAFILKNQSEEIENNLRLIDEQIREFEEFEKGIDLIENSKDKEMFSLIGKGVYLKTSLDDKELFVNIGANIIVKKTFPETKKIIEKQIKKFKEAKFQNLAQLELLRQEFGKMIKEIEDLKKSKITADEE